ncbi:MAG TPA: 50S ribosomal protein L11 methyltransferase [Jeotgalicoccus sp.]|jgi:ribosomal protein L11 methyltransferase|nr:50S ribosomal protein L11 methyltransferase [Jeotgalicoccus sp.]HBV22523.1 50S ribosomal protein L11 methyltransferase [Jeotgalicoccus sp.]
MKWHEVSISTKEENEEQFSIFLNTIAKGVSIEHSVDILKSKVDNFEEKFRLDPKDYPDSDIRILVYFDETYNIDEQLKKIREFIEETPFAHKEEIEVKTGMIDEMDWENEWKKYFHNFKVGRNFLIVPSWEYADVEIADSDKVIKIDPGMAFGTGDHATTSLCLTFLEDVIKPSDKVIDVGTGSGILAIGAYLLGARNIKATDIDDLSLQVSKENFALNDCGKDITVMPADLLKDETENYDVVVANILAHIIDDMIDDAYKLLNDNGRFIASGIIVEKRDEIITHMKAAGFSITEVLEEEGWVAILALKVA